jgi:hypothetical protein
MVNQLKTLTLSSRAFYNAAFPSFAKYMNKTFGYDMVRLLNDYSLFIYRFYQ